MRGSSTAAVLFLLSGLLPVAAIAQQATTDANQPAQAQGGQTQQHPDQAQTQNNPGQPGQTQQPSGQAQAQNSRVEPPHTPQQTDQLRQQERRSAEGTRIDRDWTAQQQADERVKQAEERMIMDRIRQRLAEENEDHQTTGRTGHRGDDMYRSPRYGSADHSEDRYYSESRPYPRVKTCVEYENGDEFCRYRD